MQSTVNATELEESLQQLLQKHKTYLTKQKKQVNEYFFPLIKSMPAEEQGEFIRILLQAAGADLVSQPLIKFAGAKKVPLAPLASFRQLLAVATLRRQLSDFQPEWVLNNKKRGFEFADALQVRRPNILVKRVTCSNLSVPYPCVIKPQDGAASRGVYLAVSSAEFIDVRTGKRFETEAALKDAMRADLSAGRVSKDLWQAEELIADMMPFRPARDLKFYCFYGVVGFVLEVDRSTGGLYCEWLADGRKAITGRYASKAFNGDGFTAEALALAEQISRSIPAPFMRIDFLKTDTQLVFGEFTPRPGKFDEFNTEFDNYLGQLYLAAEARLQQDLLAGKRFEQFTGLK
jgi:hypothetical protein